MRQDYIQVTSHEHAGAIFGDSGAERDGAEEGARLVMHACARGGVESSVEFREDWSYKCLGGGAERPRPPTL